MEINASTLHFQDVNKQLKNTNNHDILIRNCLGQRYIGSGVQNKRIIIQGTPGNALGSYLSNSHITVYGNAQDATGDTMDSGEIIIHGGCGDTTGYGMRGGKIFVKDHAGYRVGIHMKEYGDHKPIIVIGGRVGDFLGEYQAGGVIIVLGLDCDADTVPVGDFCGTGMHGGAIYIRSTKLPADLPKQVCVDELTSEDLELITPYIDEYCNHFNADLKMITSSHFYKLTPNSKNPYKQLYTQN